MARWLAIDHGSKRIGLAVGGTQDGIASPLAVIDAHPHETAVERIFATAAEYGAAGLVVGWPLNMDDTEGPQGRLARQLADELAATTELDVRLWDERLSSFAADEALAGHFTRKKKRARQDAVAAAEILRDFLSRGGPESAPHPGELREL